uniref:Putative 5.3 kDa protein n=1 Tax=Ixodes ricinus TaxID=34613 RepID=A0A0K8R6V2_IXORI
MHAVTFFIVTLLVLESFSIMCKATAAPAWQVTAKRPKCYQVECTTNDQCRVGSCTYCNNGLWGDNYCH